MKVSKKLIIQEAAEIKNFIDKNKKLPTYATINGSQFTPPQYSYLLAKQISKNSLQTISKIDVKTPSNSSGDNVDVTIYKNDYINMALRVATYMEKNRQAPNYVTTSNGKKIKFELYTYCFAKILAFYKQNTYLPNYCLFNSKDIQATNTSTTNSSKSTTTSTSNSTKTDKKTTQKTGVTSKKSNCSNPYTSTPHYTATGCNKLGQCTKYYCAPHTIHQLIRKFGITKFSEKQIAAWCGTTENGTGHQGINTAIAKISKETGIKLSVEWKYYSDMGKTDSERFKAIAEILCKPNKAILWHILYKDGGESTTGTGYGHYEYISIINLLTKYVRALNSLGTKNNDGSFNGRLQDRPFNVQSYFAKNTPANQKALCIVTMG